ncbi:MAG: 50S ribosomal protein L18, partial [Candidatus Omnitrophica bacterium]|nr:50S ribosomal protein L18 [Candidatus Omnitrophota bacterium]
MDKMARLRRKKAIRIKVKGDSTRPRLYVFRSNKHMHAGIVDDVLNKTLVFMK